MTTIEYYNLLIDKYNLPSAYAVAKLVGVSSQTAGRWAHKQGTFDDKSLLKVSELLDIPAENIKIDMSILLYFCIL